MRSFSYRKWRAENGSRLSHGEALGCSAARAWLDRLQGRLRRRRVRLLLRPDEWPVGEQLPHPCAAGSRREPHHHRGRRRRSAIKCAAGGVSGAVSYTHLADNIFKTFLIAKGDLDGIWSKADYIVEGEYFTGAQEQLYIENNGVIAAFDAEQGITLWGSLQCPYYIHKALMALCGLPEDKVRVVQMETGGAFGGKEDYPSIIAGHASLLAMKAGRPVKIIYDRLEDMTATTKRHPSRTRHRTCLLYTSRCV